jgi:hypothetical protein
MPDQSSREFLRHTIATVAYRGGKALRGAPASFAGFRVGEQSRTPAQILAHIGDLFDWALSLAQGNESWHDSTPGAWDDEVARFHAALQRFDDELASDREIKSPLERLFQGPVADALTHVGQLAMLRRLAGAPIKGENFFVADVVQGRVGAAQSGGKKEFE